MLALLLLLSGYVIQSGFMYFCRFLDFFSVECIWGTFIGNKWRHMPNKSQFQCKAALRADGLLDWWLIHEKLIGQTWPGVPYKSFMRILLVLSICCRSFLCLQAHMLLTSIYFGFVYVIATTSHWKNSLLPPNHYIKSSVSCSWSAHLLCYKNQEKFSFLFQMFGDR